MTARLLPAVVWAWAGCAGGGEIADAGCVPATCAATCATQGFRDGVCDPGFCLCSGAFDADADADDGGATEADAEADAADEAADEAGPEDAAAESGCEGFDSAGVAGAYSGTFAGFIHALGTDGPMEGSVEFVMTETGPGAWSFDGTLSGSAMGGVYPWSCSVQGVADCERILGVFYDGSVEIERVVYGFEGTMGSTFAPYRFPAGTFTGSCTDCPFPVTGDGTWTANHM